MASTELTRIYEAEHAQQGVLQNLLELYVHDMSESFPFVQLALAVERRYS